MIRNRILGMLAVIAGPMITFAFSLPFGVMLPFVIWGVFAFIEQDLLEVTGMAGWTTSGILVFWSVVWITIGATSEWKPTAGDHVMAIVGSIVCASAALICHHASKDNARGFPPSKIKRYRR